MLLRFQSALIACAVIVGIPAQAAPAHAGASLIPIETPALTGRVTDSTGRPLPNANVFLAPLNRTITTDGSGAFSFGSLPPGAYHLTAFLIGFAPTHSDVTVPATGDPIKVSIALRQSMVQLSVVQVTATPIATDPRNVAQSTVEISGQALARNMGNTVAQTLSREPGISQRYAGPAANTPVIRGLSGERVLVLQDGQRAADLSSTSSDHSLSVDPLVSQRIEVVRGPASLLYGNNALGGVVNVISNDIPTSIPGHIDGYLAGQAESATPGGAGSGGLTIPVGSSLAIVGRGGFRHVDDLRQGRNLRLDNTYFHNENGLLGLGYVGQSGSAGIAGRGYWFDYGLPTPAGDPEAGVHIKGHRRDAFASSDLNFGNSALRSLRLNGSAQWYVHDEIEASGEIGTTFNLKTQTVDATARTAVGAVTGAVGASGLFKQYQPTGEEALTPPANSNSGGAFIYQEIPIGGSSDPDVRVPRLQLGARYDVYRIETKPDDPKFGSPRSLDFNNFSGSIGLSVPLTPAVTVGVSAARAFRAPTVEELFSNAFHAALGSFDVGNANLKSETNQGVDGIVRVAGARASGQFGAFYNRVNNFIFGDIVKDTLFEDELVPLNRYTQGDATLKGLEGRFEVEVAPRIVVGALGDVVRGELKGGEPLPFMPAARAGALGRWDNGHLSIDAQAVHAFKQDRVPTAATEDDPSGIATPAYDLVDLSVGYTFSNGGLAHNITLRADNLLDKRYREATSRIKNFAFNPGRNVSLVYRVLF
jgi:iron complex outermembrane receptor protein